MMTMHTLLARLLFTALVFLGTVALRWWRSRHVSQSEGWKFWTVFDAQPWEMWDERE